MSARDSGESSRHSESISDGRPSLDAPSSNASARARFPSSSPSSARRSGEYESGSLRSRKRGGGGFLLADNSGTSRNVDSARHKPHSAYEGKGKSKADDGSLNVLKRRPANVAGGLNGSIRSSPLARVMVAQGDGQDSRSSTEGDSANFAPEQGINGARLSQDTGESTSRLLEVEELPGPPVPAPAAGGIDPTQIVNMALSLSESRRRNLSAGQFPSQSVSGRRVSSAGSAIAPPQLQGGYQAYGPGSSLRQYLNQQRQISRTMSPGTSGRNTSVAARQMSSSYAATSRMDSLSPPEQVIAPAYNFSAATLARAEKAKQYIELSSAHRQLLELLPPLKPDSTAPGNSILSVSSVPGTPNFELHKTASHANEKYPLGRQYNPLQLIRNRRLRARTRRSLNPDTQEFESVVQVSEWVAVVEEEARDPFYRVEDRVILPAYTLGSDLSVRESHDASQNGHRRNESTGGARKRPRSDWQFSPAELLAEAYWLEQDDNKQLIENRHGNKIFPPKQHPDYSQTRPSYESKRSANSIPFSTGEQESEEVDRESYRHVERGRKRHLVQHVDTGNKLKHVFNKARGRSRSSSTDLSTSDHEPGDRAKRPRLPLLTSFGEENVGLLERQMDKIMGAEMEASTSAEETLISPGTPNKWRTDPRFNRPSRSPPNGSIKEERFVPAETDITDWGQQQLLPPEHPLLQRSRKLGHPDEPRSSMEEADSTNPNCPVAAFFPGLGSDLTPPSRSKQQSPVRKSKKNIIPFIKSDGDRNRRKHDIPGPFADDVDVNRGSREASAEEPPPRSSFESLGGPERGKKVFSLKTNDSLNSFNARPSSRGKDTKEPKEPESAVRRFFKGGRLGEIVRTEGARLGDAIRKRDSPQLPIEEDSDVSDAVLEESDTDEDFESVSTRPRQTPKRTSTDATNGLLLATRIDRKGRYHIDNLPTFKSSTAKTPSEPSRPNTPNQDHIGTQQRLLRQLNRSPRLDRLAPPTLDISRVSTRTSTTSPSVNMNRTTTAETTDSQRSSSGLHHLFYPRSHSRAGKRLAAILDVPGQVGRGGWPPTALSELRAERSRSRTRRPKLADKRQWSISDASGRRNSELHLKRQSGVRAADIQRVKALLWCSGVKAGEIARRASRPRAEGPSAWLVKAADRVGADLESRCVPAKEEYVLAGRLLSDATEIDVAALHDSARAFRDSQVSQLSHRIADLRGVVESCSERARAMGDAATGFGAEVTGQRAIEVRMVMDSLDKLARARRRRLRGLRRIGFGLLEWVVLLFMWWVWFVVVVVRMVWRVFKGTGRAVRWILWLD